MPEQLVRLVDRMVRANNTSRSAFIRAVLLDEFQRRKNRELERLDQEGYARQPIQPGEFEPLYLKSTLLSLEDDQWIEVKSDGLASPRPIRKGRSSSSPVKHPSRTSAKSPLRK